ncbi:ABC transporter permease [Treponema sp. C6A8]|uniref:ABC transporter permease n=1 Tax=Treponema sp. C6A8 TaxID=1410609 RepID=UPI00047F69DD|nr:FtsX-like permease family protein [Treponema sp. C6A8]
MYQLILGFRSLFYRKKQYISLFLICFFGTGISLFSLFISKGMIASLNEKAEVYYGGDFCFMSCNWDERYLGDYEKILETAKALLPENVSISIRYDFDAQNKVSFYYEGEEVLQRVIKGVTFDSEKALFDKFNFLCGSADIKKGSNGVLISEPIAKKLGAGLGDEITLYLRNINGYINTVPLVIKGIFQDSSVFGLYTTYMDFDFLRTAYGRDSSFSNRLCVDFPGRSGISKEELEKIQSAFETAFKMHPLVDNKLDFYFDPNNTPDTYGIIPLSANLNDVNILKNAMNVVISLIIVFLVLIIVVGIGSTYRVLVMKRINEIGIYMAIGMKKKAIMGTLLIESLFLLLTGCAAGFILAEILCRVISGIKFTFIPMFSIFLTKGYLHPLFDAKGFFMLTGCVIFVTLLAVFYSVKKCVNIMPCNAIAANE